MSHKYLTLIAIVTLATAWFFVLMPTGPVSAESRQINVEPAIAPLEGMLPQLFDLQATADGTIEFLTVDPETLKMKSTFKSGERMAILVDSPGEGALYVFNSTMDGKVVCLFPNAYHEDNWVGSAGFHYIGLIEGDGDVDEEHILGRGFSLRAHTDEAGYESIFVIYVSEESESQDTTTIDTDEAETITTQSFDSLTAEEFQTYIESLNQQIYEWFKINHALPELTMPTREFLGNLKEFYEPAKGEVSKAFIIEPVEPAEEEISIQLPTGENLKRWFGYRLVLLQPVE